MGSPEVMCISSGDKDSSQKIPEPSDHLIGVIRSPRSKFFLSTFANMIIAIGSTHMAENTVDDQPKASPLTHTEQRFKSEWYVSTIDSISKIADHLAFFHLL